jgi:RNA polymerase-binding transcription factor DksA
MDHAALLDAVERELDQIDDALGRLDAGTYGSCATCGDRLAAEALATEPLLERCAGCAATDAAPGPPPPASVGPASPIRSWD